MPPRKRPPTFPEAALLAVTAWRQVRQGPKLAGRAGAGGAGFIVAIAVFAPLLGTVDPIIIDLARSKQPFTNFLLGTDAFGRDVWSRVAYGARIRDRGPVPRWSASSSA